MSKIIKTEKTSKDSFYVPLTPASEEVDVSKLKRLSKSEVDKLFSSTTKTSSKKRHQSNFVCIITCYRR
jgi:hypothetical protein